MKKITIMILLSVLLLLLCGCGAFGKGGNTSPPPPSEDASEPAEEVAAPAAEQPPETAEAAEAESAKNETPTDWPEMPVKGAGPKYNASEVGKDTLIQYFCENVFGCTEYDPSAEPACIHRWDMGLKVFIDGDCTEADRAVMDELASQLASLSGFPGIVFEDVPQKANLTIMLCGRDVFLEHFGEALGWQESDSAVKLETDKDGNISEGLICIRTDTEQGRRSCLIRKELLRAAGMLYETRLRSGSVLSYELTGSELVDVTDFMILQLLYDDSLYSGMDAPTAVAYLKVLLY